MARLARNIVDTRAQWAALRAVRGGDAMLSSLAGSGLDDDGDSRRPKPRVAHVTTRSATSHLNQHSY